MPRVWDWQASRQATDRLYRDLENERRAERRRWLYANDPIWRLTKRKANWETRERGRRVKDGAYQA